MGLLRQLAPGLALDLEVPEPIALPGGEPDPALRPHVVPVQGVVAEVLPTLPLHQREPEERASARPLGPRVEGVDDGLAFLVAGHDSEVGDRLLEVDGVVAHDHADVHRDQAAVVAGMAMPHPVEADDDVPPVPQAEPVWICSPALPRHGFGISPPCRSKLRAVASVQFSKS